MEWLEGNGFAVSGRGSRSFSRNEFGDTVKEPSDRVN